MFGDSLPSSMSRLTHACHLSSLSAWPSARPSARPSASPSARPSARPAALSSSRIRLRSARISASFSYPLSSSVIIKLPPKTAIKMIASRPLLTPPSLARKSTTGSDASWRNNQLFGAHAFIDTNARAIRVASPKEAVTKSSRRRQFIHSHSSTSGPRQRWRYVLAKAERIAPL